MPSFGKRSERKDNGMSYKNEWEYVASRLGVNPDIFTPNDVIDLLTDDECRSLAMAWMCDDDADERE